MLIFSLLKSLFSQSNAKLDSHNLKTFEQYDKAEHQQMFANICLSKKIQEIYKHNWLYTLINETRVAYENDIQYFIAQWKLTMSENHQSVANFVESFCEKVHCTQPQVMITPSMDNTMNLLISHSIIEIKTHYEISLHNKIITDRLLVLLRQWYIIYHSQNNSFPFHLQGYMRYIEINIRYFYDSDLGVYQPIEADLINIKDLNV